MSGTTKRQSEILGEPKRQPSAGAVEVPNYCKD